MRICFCIVIRLFRQEVYMIRMGFDWIRNNYSGSGYSTARILLTSVADPGCLSRIPGTDFYPSRIPEIGSRIPDPKTVTKERGEKNFVIILFLWSQISQNWILCYFWNAKEKNLGQFSKNCWSFYPKNFQYALKYMGSGSGIRKRPIPDPGSRGQKGTGSRILDPDPQHCS